MMPTQGSAMPGQGIGMPGLPGMGMPNFTPQQPVSFTNPVANPAMTLTTVPSFQAPQPTPTTQNQQNQSSEEDGDGGWADFSGGPVPDSSRTSEPKDDFMNVFDSKPKPVVPTLPLQKQQSADDPFGELFSARGGEAETEKPSVADAGDGFDDFGDFGSGQPSGVASVE